MVTEPSGGTFYDDPATHARYRGNSEPARFDPTVVMEGPAVWAAVGDPTGLRVLDLGCGDAGFGRQLLRAGCAGYHGVDASSLMVEHAELNLAATSGTVEHADLRSFRAPAASYDLVTARLSLHYLPDLDPVLAAAVDALSPGGRVVITVVHPVITCHDTPSTGKRTDWTVDDYFVPGPRPRPWLGSEVTWYHRTTEDYCDALIAAGITLTALRECAPVPERFDGDGAELARRRRVPLFLLLSGHV